MYIKTMIAVLITFFLLLSGCGGGSEDNLKLKSDDLGQDALNKITLYAETDGKSSVPSIEDYTLAGVVGVTSENLTLLNQKVSKSDARNVDDPKKIEQILKNQDFDGDGVKDRLDNCPLVANTGQADSDNNGIGDVCDTTIPVVTDTTAPVITVLGANPLSLSVGDTFNDPGATALDNADGNLTGPIRVNSNVNTSIAGTYAVNYSVSDAAGNPATAKRSVVVNGSTAPPLGEGITIQNSVDMMWEDMTGANTGYASNMPNGYAQFQGPILKDINSKPDSSFNEINIWFEIEASGDGGDCSLDVNRATNTKVQIGWTRGYYLMNDNSWVLATQTKDVITGGAGKQHPHNGQVNFPIGTSRCDPFTSLFYNIQLANSEVNVVTKTVDKFSTVKPEYYYRYHGWAARAPIDLTQVKGIFGQSYMRLTVDDPTLPDDRHLANYVGHLSSDAYYRNIDGVIPYKGDLGISRYKQITNDWQPFNFFNGTFTKTQLEANPPPFTSTP